MTSDELERLELRARLHDELDALFVTGTVRDEMLGEPGRALALVRHVKSSRGVRNPAALLISRWRERRTPAPSPEPEPELVEEPPTLDALEHAWSLERAPTVSEREPSLGVQLVLRLMAIAIARHGGFEPMRADFERRRPDSV